MKLTNQQTNMLKELQKDPYCTLDRAVTHFINICGKYHADPQKVLNVMSEGYDKMAAEKKLKYETK